MAARMLCQARDAVERLFLGPRQNQAQSPDAKAGVMRMLRASNAGLVWSRYLDVWTDGDPPTLVEGELRRGALLVFAEDFNVRAKMGDSQAVRALSAIHRRQSAVVEHHRGRGEALDAVLESRFATGLGGPHPTEIGFTFDRSAGVPFLPGSSVKGIARSAAELLEDADLERLFGPPKIVGESKVATGDLVFLDAYPAAWPRLEVDIVNCHHPSYYADPRGRSNVRGPSEAESPVPVYFLTVAKGTRWTFRVLSRSGTDARRGVELLRAGLCELGAGAKTAVGYGLFTA